jgi:hypothetical protein
MLKIDIDRFDNDYAQNMVHTEHPEDIIQAVLVFLRKSDHETYQYTCCLVRDLVLSNKESEERRAFNTALDKSRIITILEKNLLSNNYFKRSASIYTLAKILSKSSVGKMRKALDRLAIIDPINASDLVSEIWWLDGGGKKDWRLIDKLAKMKTYSRWAGLHVLSHWSGGRQFESDKKKYLQQFAEDENALIRTEAKHLLEEKRKRRINPKENGSSSTNVPWDPIVTFDDLRTGIGNWLYKRKKRDYRLEDLNALLEAKLRKAAV